MVAAIDILVRMSLCLKYGSHKESVPEVLELDELLKRTKSCEMI